MTSTRTACEGTPARRKRRRPAVQLPRCGTAWFVSLLLLATTNSVGAQTNPEQQSPTPPSAAEQPTSTQPDGSPDNLPDNLSDNVSAPTSSDPGVRALAGISQSISQNPSLRPSLQTAITFATLAIVPIVLLMTTGYIRMAVVLGLLRQGFGAASAPPPQVTTALAVFLTVLVMMPVWQQVKRDALDPYLASENPISLTQAVEHGVQPIKRFMSQQLIASGNTQDVWLFLKYLPEEQRQTMPKTFQEVPLQVLVPAFMVSELKVAFAIGFQIYLPFLLIDLLVTSLITALGMSSLSPQMVSLPLKLALFVMVDGWNLIVGMLLRSFAAMTL